MKFDKAQLGARPFDNGVSVNEHAIRFLNFLDTLKRNFLGNQKFYLKVTPGGGRTSIMSSTGMPKVGYLFQRKILSLRYVFGGKIP